MALNGCERPFTEASPPEISVVEPDFSRVFVSPNTPIRVEARSFRPVNRVEINGRPMSFDPDRVLWEEMLQLQLGLNAFFITATDVDGTRGVDTVYAVYLPFQYQIGPPLLAPRGGHTATLLLDGSVLVTGGTSRVGGPAQAEAFLLAPGGTAFRRLPQTLNEARTGHTATLLPDGRVLILGGSRIDILTSVIDLVESVEIYDPAARTFTPVPFSGQPIRRTLHTASLRSDALVDLYGGRGDIRYEPDPRLGTRRDLRTFRFTGDSLIALNTLRSAPELAAAISGHTQTPLAALTPGQPGRYLVAGSFFDELGTDDVSFEVDFTRPPQIFLTDTPPLRTSRTQHAAALLRDGFVVFFGGRQFTPADALNETELYVDETERFFRFPVFQLPVKRFGLTATKLPSGRILLLGGFSSDGNSLIGSEFFDSDF